MVQNTRPAIEDMKDLSSFTALGNWEDVVPTWKVLDTDNDASSDYTSWQFNIWPLDYPQLMKLGLLVFNHHINQLTEHLDLKACQAMIFEVQHYMSNHRNPYHNYHHVMDVFQTCGVILDKYHGNVWLNDTDRIALLLSALLHDLDHPGLNNMYQVNAVTPLAVRYNDLSVLENYHAAIAVEMLQKPQFNIFPKFELNKKKAIRKTMISLILATDMSTHFNLKDEVDAAATKVMAKTLTPDNVTDKEKTLLMKSILHLADISNPGKPWEISKRWSDMVIQEFFAQGDIEKEEQLPVSMGCDRNTVQQDEVSLNFADFFVAPFYFSLTKWLPGVIEPCTVLVDNRTKWHNLLKERLLENSQDQAITEETMGKWEGRRTAMDQKLNDLKALFP